MKEPTKGRALEAFEQRQNWLQEKAEGKTVIREAIWRHIKRELDLLWEAYVKETRREEQIEDISAWLWDSPKLQELRSYLSWTYPAPNENTIDREFPHAGDDLPYLPQHINARLHQEHGRTLLPSFMMAHGVPHEIAMHQPLTDSPPKPGRHVETRYEALRVLEEYDNSPDQPTFEEAAKRLGYAWNGSMDRQVDYLRKALEAIGIRLSRAK